MAWNGDVHRMIFCIKPAVDGLIAELDCGHEAQIRHRLPLLTTTMPCPVCSAAPRERINEYRKTVRFDDVLSKIKGMGVET